MSSKTIVIEEPKAAAGQRQFSGAEGRAIRVYCVLVALYHMFYVSGLLSRAGIFMPGLLHRAVSLTLIGALVFLLYPAYRGAPMKRVPWYDIVLIVLTFVAVGFAAYGYEHLRSRVTAGYPDTVSTVMAWTTMLVIFEGTRRVLGMAMPLIALLFVVQTMLSNYLPGIFTGRGYGFERIAMDLFVTGDTGIFGLALDVGSTVVVMFVIFAQLLNSTGAGNVLINSALALFGHVRGGPAKVAVVASAAFGTLSGSTIANVVATGTVTIPLSKRIGYKPHMAAAIEAVASNGGQIMPPVMGIVAFLIAEWLQIPYWEVVVAALLPAILYYIALFIMIDFEAAKTGMRGVPREQLPSFWKTMKEGWYFILPIIALIFFIGVLRDTPERAALYSLILVVLLSLRGKKETRLTPAKGAIALESGIKSATQVLMACATAGVLIGAIGITNLGVRLSAFLIDISQGNLLVLLLLTALVAYIMGMGTSSIAIYVTLVLLIAPALVKMGVLPIGAHLFVFYWGLTSMITPPVAIAAYAAAAIAGADPFRTGFTAMRLSIVLYLLPFLWIYFPSLVLQGTPGDIIVAAVTAIIGTGAISAGLAGYLFKPARWWERLMFLAGGAGLITAIVPVEIGGAALLGVSALTHWKRRADRAA